MTRLIPEDLFPYSLAPTLDTRVFLFAFGVAVAAGLLFGALPAMRASRVELVTALRGEVAPTGRLSGARLRSLFVVSQVTVSLVLLVVTGLMLSSLQRARTFDPGFDSEGVLLAEINLTRNGYDRERGAQLFRDLESRLAELPGVRSVASPAASWFRWDFPGSAAG